MKPILLPLLLCASLFAADGYKIYEQHCASCHMVMLPLNEPERGLQKAKMKAPTMRMVSMRLKMMIHIHNEDEDIQRKVVKAFIKEYIDDPDEDYVLCLPEMVEKFGVMTPVKGLTNAEKEAVAEWLWEQF
ncbi:hypothetical protein WCX18_07085 [Sulfurimonas sp. HSL1-2]|uniref:hypothetical protein n=1 Tax=Thiomicrolovo zhangzhouensis TaxID=3131933 RepID=UPI0031F97989